MSALTKPGYIAALDGIRGLAITLVVIAHAGFEHIVPGMLGVNLFFVLSGFLITRQLLSEYKETNKIALGRFYLRRAFRLLPPLIFYLLVFIPILLLFGAPITNSHIASALFYYANYYHIFFGYPALSPFPILWSLSVEEHFYILFPLLLSAALHRSQPLLPWLTAAVILALVWRILLFSECRLTTIWTLCGSFPGRRLEGTDAIFDAILYGAILAAAARDTTGVLWKWVMKRPTYYVAVAALMLSLILRNDAFRETFRLSLQSAAIMIMFAHILFAPSNMLRPLLERHTLTALGKLSYSLYLFHYGALVLLHALKQENSAPDNALEYFFYFIISLIMSLASWHMAERPFRRFRERLRLTWPSRPPTQKLL